MTTTSRGRKLTHNITNMWQRESVRALQMMCTVGIFAEVVYDWWCHEIPRYTGITVFLRRYIIVGQFLILHIPKTTPAATAAETSHVARSPQGERGQVAGEALW